MRVLAVLLAATLWSAAALLAAPVDWPQFNSDPAHTGAPVHETMIHGANVSTLHVRYSVTLPAVADGSPVYFSNVDTAGGSKDLLFLTTKDGRILALDATDGSTVWSRQPATGPGSTTSIPAVGLSGRFVYSYGLDGKVHEYQIGDGTEITTGGWPEVTTLKPSVESCSSALTIAATQFPFNNNLYVTHGGYAVETGDYQGHLTTINVDNGGQTVWNAVCSDQAVHFVTGGSPDCASVKAGIWARGGVTVSDVGSLTHLFFATGDGPFDAATGGHNWGDSVIDMRGFGNVFDSYTPTEFQQLQDNGLDLGSAAPARFVPLISTDHELVAQVGKDGKLRLLSFPFIGASPPTQTGGELQKIDVPQGGAVTSSMAVWVDPVDDTSWLFVANANGISGLQLIQNQSTETLAVRWTNTGAGTGGTSPVVVNGLVFYATTAGLKALDPPTGNLLWSDAGTIGPVHWESPIVVKGKVYVTDENAKLWAFEPNLAPLDFYTVTPCRVVDTRRPAGPYGGPPVGSPNPSKRLFTLTGQCGVPADALAVTANLTVVSGGEELRVGPSGFYSDDVTSPNVTNTTNGPRAGNAVLSLTGYPVGAVQVTVNPSFATDFLLDVSGYFKAHPQAGISRGASTRPR